MIWLCLFGWVICFWVIFFDGAERLEGTFLGYFEFGQFADKASYIKALAWIGLITTAGLILVDIFS